MTLNLETIFITIFCDIGLITLDITQPGVNPILLNIASSTGHRATYQSYLKREHENITCNTIYCSFVQTTGGGGVTNKLNYGKRGKCAIMQMSSFAY